MLQNMKQNNDNNNNSYQPVKYVISIQHFCVSISIACDTAGRFLPLALISFVI